MSEAPKTVEEPVAPVATEAPATTEPAAEVKAAEPDTVEPAAEASATAEEATKEEEAAPKEEVKPIEEGVLGYKGPGLIKGLIFQKKFFWFGTDAVESKAFASYLRGEKNTAAANHTVAWASHTGKGLLFFSKKAADKAAPQGIFNLADVTDLAEEGTVEFHFTSGGHKHTFQSAHLAERDNWVAQLKAKIEEAKTLGETVEETEEYKTAHSALTKSVVPPAVAPKKVEEPKEVKKEEAAEAKEEKKEEKKEVKEEKKEEKKSRKSRSASRKRTSIFGGINFGGKKEEKVSEPKEEAAVAPATEEATTEAAATESPVVIEPTGTEEPASPTEPAAKPTPTKRNSIFGTLKSQFSQNKEKKAEEAPAVPAKDAETEPVSENAPVIPQVESTEPLATEVTPEAAPIEPTVAPVTNGEAKAVETPVVKSDKRKSSLPWLTKKEKPTSDEEGDKEKPKSPFAKLRATVKGKSSPKAEKVEKPAEPKVEEPAAATEEATAAAAEPIVEAPVVSEPVPAVTTSAPQVAASA